MAKGINSEFYNTEINAEEFYNGYGVDGTSALGNEFEFVSSNGVVRDKQYDAIEILAELARQGKIDPWNLDIVDVYDKYMAKLAELKANNNLKFAGRALLFASILLKLKSNVLEGINILDFEPQEEQFEEYDQDYDDGFEPVQMQLPSSNIISFDEVLQRRTSVRLNRNRSVTLKDLIRHLEFYEELEKKRTLQNTLERQKRRVRNYSKLKPNDILNLAHDEYIEQVVEKMRQNLNKILEREKSIELTELTLLGFDKSSAYIAILFLVSRENFEVFQDEFYSKLYVRKANPQEVEQIAN